MTIITHIAQLLAAIIIGGLCVMMYLDLPVRAPGDSGRKQDTQA